MEIELVMKDGTKYTFVDEKNILININKGMLIIDYEDSEHTIYPLSMVRTISIKEGATD